MACRMTWLTLRKGVPCQRCCSSFRRLTQLWLPCTLSNRAQNQKNDVLHHVPGLTLRATCLLVSSMLCLPSSSELTLYFAAGHILHHYSCHLQYARLVTVAACRNPQELPMHKLLMTALKPCFACLSCLYLHVHVLLVLTASSHWLSTH